MQKKEIAHIVVGDIATNCWLYPLAETNAAGRQIPPGFTGCALIDPGGGANHIISRLNGLKLFPVYILLTHGHFDHIAAVPDLVAAYRQKAGGTVVAIHRDDAEYLGPLSFAVHCRSIGAAGGSAAYIKTLWEDMPPPDQTLEEGGSIGPFTVLHLPGHTPGSIGLWDKSAGVLFSGDTLFLGDYGRTDLPGGSEAQIVTSLKRLFSMDGGIKVYPGHGPATTIGEEASRGMV
jgi:glyoxylase-like metal-dependent hydrolase (beta-lactamase superfamily II)